MQNNLHGLGVERTVRYDVHQLNIPGWQSITGQPIEEALGMKKGQRAILGYKNGNPVFANGASRTTSRTSSRWAAGCLASRCAPKDQPKCHIFRIDPGIRRTRCVFTVP